ncbi:MAG: sugar phosphate isomerase/epimerase [Lentisphaeria bacterium]|nr:sugar phosphate isomerase/epimerase [Lentisphaeria bacterium]
MIKQSVAFWCFNSLEPEEFFSKAYEIGYRGIEMVPAKHRALARQIGLEVINHNCGQIEVGLNKVINHEKLIPVYQQGIRQIAVDGIEQLIVFCGNRDGQLDAEGLANTIDGFKKIITFAEENNVVLTLELFNQEDHPDYLGDQTKFGIDLCREVNSPNLKILYDVYHMAKQNQNLLKDLVENLDLIGHLHLAAKNKRSCTADCEEIPYKEIVSCFHRVGYRGYWGQEFIVTDNLIDELKRSYDFIAACE